MANSILTPKKMRFVDEYLIDLNATRAYLRAGFVTKNDEVAGQLAHRLLKDVKVQALIEARKKELRSRTDITVQRVLLELARIGFSDARKLFDDKGQLKPIKELGDDIAHVISSIEVVEIKNKGNKKSKWISRIKKIKLWDKVAALEKLAKHLNLYDDRTNQVNNVLVMSDDEQIAAIRNILARVGQENLISGYENEHEQAAGMGQGSLIPSRIEASPSTGSVLGQPVENPDGYRDDSGSLAGGITPLELG